jgi:hypothetical protein
MMIQKIADFMALLLQTADNVWLPMFLHQAE